MELIRQSLEFPGVNIFIKKYPQLPDWGGSRIVWVLLGLNRLWNLNIDDEALRLLGKSLGADVPFCLTGGTALAQGIGEILTPIASRADIWLVIIRPNIWVSTKEIYGRLDLNSIGKRPDNEAMIKHLGAGRITGIAENLVNVLRGHHTHASANRQDKIPIDGTGCSGQPDERHRSYGLWRF